MQRNDDISEVDLAEVERRQVMPNVPGQWVTLSITERDTLCATIRRLRATLPPSPTVDEAVTAERQRIRTELH